MARARHSPDDEGLPRNRDGRIGDFRIGDGNRQPCASALGSNRARWLPWLPVAGLGRWSARRSRCRGFGGQVDLAARQSWARAQDQLQAVPDSGGALGDGCALEAVCRGLRTTRLFYPDRKPIAVHVPRPGFRCSAQPLDVALTSVIMTPTLQMAIVQDPQSKDSMRVREGQALGGAYSGAWRLTVSCRRARPRSTAIRRARCTLDLRIFDGKRRRRADPDRP